MLHRGGALFAERPETCDEEAAENGPLDEQSEYCVIAAWFQKERAARLPEQSQLRSIVFVRRDAAALPDTPQDYASYSGPAKLVEVAAQQTGRDITLGSERDLSALCGLAWFSDIVRSSRWAARPACVSAVNARRPRALQVRAFTGQQQCRA